VRLGPGRSGYGLKLEPGPQALIDAALSTWPRLRQHWDGICVLLRRQGHMLGEEVRFQGIGHRIVSFASHPDGQWPAIDVIYMIDVDRVLIDILVVKFAPDD
jgi:hypothetical protein